MSKDFVIADWKTIFSRSFRTRLHLKFYIPRHKQIILNINLIIIINLIKVGPKRLFYFRVQSVFGLSICVEVVTFPLFQEFGIERLPLAYNICPFVVGDFSSSRDALFCLVMYCALFIYWG